MNEVKFYELLLRLAEIDHFSMHEHVKVTGYDFKPLTDEDGDPVIRDILQFGDAKIFIERDGNEPSAEQDLIDFLGTFHDFLPEIAEGLKIILSRRIDTTTPKDGR